MSKGIVITVLVEEDGSELAYESDCESPNDTLILLLMAREYLDQQIREAINPSDTNLNLN